MKKINKCIIWALLSTLSILAVDVSVYAAEQKDAKSGYLLIGTGIESLSYNEHEPDTGTDTDISLYNVVTKFEGCMNLENVFFNIKGILPIYLGNEKEEWERSGSIYQTNNLKYAWTRIDGNAGYRFYNWLKPYLGLRWSKSRHKRSNFYLLSEPVNMEATETNEAFFVAAGLKGDLKSPPEWQFQYSIECFMPVSSRTENSALSGWKSTAEDGYTVGARVVARYIYSPSVSLYLELSGERAYWDGSDWIDYSGGLAKWPENETISLDGTIGIAWSF